MVVRGLRGAVPRDPLGFPAIGFVEVEELRAVEAGLGDFVLEEAGVVDEDVGGVRDQRGGFEGVGADLHHGW